MLQLRCRLHGHRVKGGLQEDGVIHSEDCRVMRTPRPGNGLATSGRSRDREGGRPQMVSGAGCSLRGRLPAVPRGAIPQEGGYSRGEPDSGVWAGVCRSVLVFRDNRLVYVQLPCLTVPSEGAERATQTPKCHTTARLRCLGAALEMVLPCSTSLTCTGVWGITAGRQKWAQAYPSPSSHAYSPSTLISLASYPTPVSLQPFLFGEPASIKGGVRVYQERVCWKERI